MELVFFPLLLRGTHVRRVRANLLEVRRDQVAGDHALLAQHVLDPDHLVKEALERARLPRAGDDVVLLHFLPPELRGELAHGRLGRLALPHAELVMVELCAVHGLRLAADRGPVPFQHVSHLPRRLASPQSQAPQPPILTPQPPSPSLRTIHADDATASQGSILRDLPLATRRRQQRPCR
ncbi:hypothetical protein T484DRAFT_1977890 [Baffinella frigidus]|nr:hypothetical protein T484DRAFT_1977890 [Cryptophyta sp. CCMP2293]